MATSGLVSQAHAHATTLVCPTPPMMPTTRRQSPKHRNETTDDEKRRGDSHEDLILDHMREEEAFSEPVKRATGAKTSSCTQEQKSKAITGKRCHH